MLLQLRDYLQRERVASTQQLGRTFRMAQSALLPMLEFWVGKGVIRRTEAGADCKSACFKCNENKPDYYEWVSPTD